jgi:transcriptional regulator with XRE-family HTH domain
VTERRAYEDLASLDAIARAAGISVDRLHAILAGDFDPDLELVDRIAQALGVTASELIAEPDYN